MKVTKEFHIESAGIPHNSVPSNDFFKKLFSEQKNHQKSSTFCWFLNFYDNIYGWIRQVLKKSIAGHSKSVEILPKC